ncbi:MAG: hypothetical protein K1000chlam2_01591 [Chlamydiae bacterium]|nr:hypothetical protein [Chlamydiota bacterium]
MAAITSVQRPTFSVPGIRTTISNRLEFVALYLSKPAHIASKPLIRAFATPIRPGKDGNWNSAIGEKIWRVFISTIGITTAPLTIGLALIGSLLDKTADLIKQKSYTHLRGSAPEKQEDDAYRLMTQNACMLWGGLPIPLGGMRPPSDRMDQFAKKICEEDPDILVMQEMAFDPSYSLYQKIKNNYAHFFTRIGPNPPLMESGLFVASKYAILQAGFIPFPKQLGIKRGAFWIETPKAFFFTTHMEFGPAEGKIQERQAQIDLIMKKIDECKKEKPCFLLGDFNLDRSVGEHYQNMQISENFHDPYFKKYPKLDEQSATCTDEITAYTLGNPPPQKKWEMVDYALLARGPHEAFKLDVDLVQMYNNEQPYKALSDHRGLVLRASK